MKIRNVFLLMAAGMLVSCSKSEIETPVLPGSDDIVLRSAVAKVDATSRLAYEGTDLATKPLEALVAASLTTLDYSSLYCYGTMTFNGSTTGTSYNKVGLLGNYKYPVDGTAFVYLTGLHPATGWIGVGGTPAAPTTTDGELEFTLTGKDDVMLAEQVSTTLNNVKAASYATLDFKHQLTLMKLSLSAEVADKIKVQSIQLIKANKADLATEVTVSLNDQDISFAIPSSVVALDCYQTDTDDTYSFASGLEYEVTTTAEEQAYVLAPPVAASNVAGTCEYTFRIAYLDGVNSKTKDVDVDLKDKDGNLFDGTTVNYAFNITLKFVDGEIVINAKVSDWSEGGTFDQDI